jgi:eukaryotic-like serine/threonine-protein kinase
LGPYEIVAPVGVGGMGEVYRARDTRLGRPVAIKVIASDSTEDPKRRLRFQREAKAVSSLNHPNICALYDVGEVPLDVGGEADQKHTRQYIVMEYLEGETLEERLRKGPLPLDQVFRYGLEIADALDKAHRKQILHRDLKPSNIMITKTGARLFDFGLAKFLRGSPSSKEVSVEASSRGSTSQRPITAEGSVLGTLEYIAPEQLQGKEPDARTDIFSFGVCLYQMITGRRPFEGSTRASLAAAILEHDPLPLSTYQPSSPSSLDWLVKNCLAKDPDERFQTAHDIVLELKRMANEVGSAPLEPFALRKTSQWAQWSVAAMVLVMVAALVFIVLQLRRTGSPKPAVKRFSISLPATAPLAEGPFEKFAVSSDGTRIAYVGGTDPARLYLYSVDTLETKPVPGTEGARGPFFSLDGQWIGFYTVDEGLKKVALGGATPVLLSAERDLRGASWGPDNTIVFADTLSPLRRISASGGRSEPLSPGDPMARFRWPSLLPGGESVLYTVNDFSGDYENARLVVRSLKTGQTKTVLEGATYGRYVSGHLIYLHSQMLFAVPFDVRAMKITGSPVSIASDVDSYFTSGLAHFGASSDGSIFYIPRDSSEAERELVWVDRAGKSTPVTPIHRINTALQLSPDDMQLVVSIGLAPARLDIWLYDMSREAWTRLTTEARNLSGIWSPDGRQIAFASNRRGGFDLYIMPRDGSALPRRITARKSWDIPGSWSPDGKAIAVVEQYRATFSDIFIVAPREGAAPTPFLNTSFDERDPVFSPDGHWMAYRSNESGRDEIYVQRYPSTGRKLPVSTNGGTTPVWRKDGRELFYRNGNKMMAVATRLEPDFSAEKPQMLFEGDFEEDYDVTRDGQRFIMVKRPPQRPRTQINVILGLFGSN